MRFRYLILTGLIVAGYGFYRSIHSGVTDIKTGSVILLYPAQVYTQLTATGYVVPQTRADVASKATGRLEKIEVAEGQYVKKGQILARIENNDIKASLNRSEADLETAKTTLASRMADLKEAELALRRADVLLGKNFYSRASHDIELARHERAKAAVANASAMIRSAAAVRLSQEIALEYTLIKAPFDGVILRKNADVGDMLAPFASTSLSKGSVVSMADLESLEVEADVSESNLLKVHTGQACEVQLDAIPEERFPCEVGTIVPTLDKTRATILVKSHFTRKDVRFLPDMSAKVAYLSQALTQDQARSVTAVPASAVVVQEGQSVVFRVDGDTLKRVVLDAPKPVGDFLVIQPLLDVGTPVVLNPQVGWQDGLKVRVQQN